MPVLGLKVTPPNIDMPFKKPVPVILTFCWIAPCARLDGLAEVTTGTVEERTLKTSLELLLMACAPSGFVTVMLRGPTVAFEAIVILAVNEVALFQVGVPFTVMPDPKLAV